MLTIRRISRYAFFPNVISVQNYQPCLSQPPPRIFPFANARSKPPLPRSLLPSLQRSNETLLMKPRSSPRSPRLVLPWPSLQHCATPTSSSNLSLSSLAAGWPPSLVHSQQLDVTALKSSRAVWETPWKSFVQSLSGWRMFAAKSSVSTKLVRKSPSTTSRCRQRTLSKKADLLSKKVKMLLLQEPTVSRSFLTRPTRNHVSLWSPRCSPLLAVSHWRSLTQCRTLPTSKSSPLPSSQPTVFKLSGTRRFVTGSTTSIINQSTSPIRCFITRNSINLNSRRTIVTSPRVLLQQWPIWHRTIPSITRWPSMS